MNRDRYGSSKVLQVIATKASYKASPKEGGETAN